jgi:hypothetical protein
VEYDWTSSGYDAAVGQGVTPEEVHYVLVHAKSRIRRYEDDHLRVIGRTHAKRLIEIWLREESSDYWLVVIAFEAGLAGRALFRRLFGSDGE